VTVRQVEADPAIPAPVGVIEPTTDSAPPDLDPNDLLGAHVECTVTGHQGYAVTSRVSASGAVQYGITTDVAGEVVWHSGEDLILSPRKE